MSATTGVVIAYGVVSVRALDHIDNSADKFVLAGGSFNVFASQGSGPTGLNSTTCLLSASNRGAFMVHGGTGTFKHISARGKYQVTILSIQARSNWPLLANQAAAPISADHPCRRPGNPMTAAHVLIRGREGMAISRQCCQSGS